MTKEVAEKTQIFYLELLTKKLLKIFYALHIVTYNDHVIDMYQEKGDTTIWLVEE